MSWPFGVRGRVTIAVAVLVALVLGALATAFLSGVEDTVATGAIADSEDSLDQAQARADDVQSDFLARLRFIAESSGQERGDFERRVNEQREDYERELADWEEQLSEDRDDFEPPEPPEAPEPPEPPEPPEASEQRLTQDFELSLEDSVSVFDATGVRISDPGDVVELAIGSSPDAINHDATLSAVCRRSSARTSCDVDGADARNETAQVLDDLERLARVAHDELGSDVPGVVVGRVVNIGEERILVITAQRVEDVETVAEEVLPWIVIGALAAAIGTITWFALGRTLNPVKAMTAEVDHITDRNLDQRITVPRANDELQQLARTMNRMLDRLLASRDRQRRFVSDASHELRSPITAVQATLEVALAHPDDADWPQVAGVVSEENSRLGALVDDLLLLARLDEDPGTEVTMAVDLDEVCLIEAERARRVPVRVHVQSPARVTGSLPMLTRAVRNLIDNAAEHAKTGVDVEVEAVTNDDGAWNAVVSVRDDGPGIAPKDRKVVFERFTRLDEARSRSTGGGAGLGLAIVAGIAEAHGGVVTAGSSDSFGACFVLSLPIIT